MPDSDHHYDWQYVRAYCVQLNMPVDEPGLALADSEAAKYGLTQEQFDASLRLHAHRVKTLFDPKQYSMWGRILIALYFLTGIGAR